MRQSWRLAASAIAAFCFLSLASTALAQTPVLCTDSSVQCAQKNGQYGLLYSFQNLASTPQGQALLSADLAKVVSIYQNATPAQRDQAYQNSVDVTYTAPVPFISDSYNPFAQYNIWQMISSSSTLLPTLTAFPQLSLSSTLATKVTDVLAGEVDYFNSHQSTDALVNAITFLLQGDGGANQSNISSIQHVGTMKDNFTAYATMYPYLQFQTIFALPPCPPGEAGKKTCQNDPRPYQITNQIAQALWQPGQASATAITGQLSNLDENTYVGGFPSGHSTYGNTTALLWAMMLPQAYQSLMVSGQQFGLSRNILGVHHTLDIIGGRMLAYYTMTQLMANNPDYLLSDVSTYEGVTYTTFSAYVGTLSYLLNRELPAQDIQVPYAACAANVASCMSSGVIPTAAQFAAANAAYASQATYDLPSIGATNLAPVVPTNSYLLLQSRFPYLSQAQIEAVIASTELPSGGALDDGSGWVRLNLFKAAGGYGAFTSNVSVTLDASQPGYNAVDMWSNDISGPGGLIKNGTGLLILGGTDTYTGGTTVAGGTLALTGSMVGNLSIQPGATFVSSGGYSVAAGATLTNQGTFQSVNSTLLNNGTINNSGTLIGGVTNNGVFNQTGGAFNNASSLINNATFNGNISNTGLIGGNGTINGTLTNGGTLSPGNSIGTLTVNGSYVQAAGSNYLVEAAANATADRLNVTGAPGTATLGGGVVQVLPGAGTYAPSTTYTIVNATGGVTGRFAGVTNPFPFLQASLGYDASNVYLTLRPGGFAAGAATPNQAAVGAAMDRSVAGASGDFATIVGTLATTAQAQGQAFMNAVSGVNYAGFSSANIGTGQLFMNAVGRQLDGARGGDPGTTTRTALAEACDFAAESCAASPWSAWMSALAGFGSIAGNANVGALTYSGGGVASGIDYRLDPRLLVGFGIGFVSSSQWTGGLSGQGTTNSYQASLYGSFNDGGLWIDGLAGYGYNDNRMTRLIVIPGLQQRTAYGQAGANQLLGQVEAGYRFGLPLPAATIAPFARLQGTTVTQNGFTESGAGSLNLAVAGQTTNSLRSTLGLQLGGGVPMGTDRNIGLLMRLGWAHEFADTARPVTASFAGAPGSNFTVLGAPPSRDAAVLALAANTRVGESTSIYLRYDGEIGGGSDAHALTAGFRLTW